MGPELPNSNQPRQRSRAITGQEFTVLGLASMGYSDLSIGDQMGISRAAIASNWRRILSKVGASSRNDALKKLSRRLAAGSDSPNAPIQSHNEDSRSKFQSDTDQQNKLLRAISDASLSYIDGRQNVRQLYSRLLDSLLDLTHSHYGLVAEVRNENGKLVIGEYALTCSGWDAAAQAKFEGNYQKCLRFEELDPLIYQTVTSRKVVIENARQENGVTPTAPEGHPVVQDFLGIPVFCGFDLVGVIALANRREGYDSDVVDFLKPLTMTCANLTVAWRMETARRAMQLKLDSATCLMRTMVERSDSAVMYETADRKLEFINDRFASLFGVEAAPSQVVGLHTALVIRHSKSLVAEPALFEKRVENLVEGQESCYDERIPMADGKVLLRDFVVVRSGNGVSGYFWHYHDASRVAR